MKKFLVLLMFFSSYAYADSHEDLVHFTAHAGASYAIDTVAYGFDNRVLGLRKADSEVIALGTTLLIGYGYKRLEGSANTDTMGRALSQDTIGAALSILTHVTFRF